MDLSETKLVNEPKCLQLCYETILEAIKAHEDEIYISRKENPDYFNLSLERFNYLADLVEACFFNEHKVAVYLYDPGKSKNLSYIVIDYLEEKPPLNRDGYSEDKFQDNVERLYQYYSGAIGEPKLDSMSELLRKYMYYHVSKRLIEEKGYKIRLEKDRSWTLEKL